MMPFQFRLEEAARQAVNRLEKQAQSGSREAAALLVNAGAAFLGKSPRPLPELPDAPEQGAVRLAVYDMLRAGKLTPGEASDIVRMFG